MKTVCLISTGQPSTNPRLIKEADSLSERGFDVTAICSFWSSWAYGYDDEILSDAKWKCIYVGGNPISDKARYLYTRLRFKMSRYFSINALENYRLSRTTPELIEKAKSLKADLYIGHNLGALPAAVIAAEHNSSKCGFDAEDFHSGMNSSYEKNSNIDRFNEKIERKYLYKCDYITSASKKISEAYTRKYGIDEPETVLNVFPLNLRPVKLRDHDYRKPLKLYWFSQTIGPKRGLEDVIRAMGIINYPDIELHLLGHPDNNIYKTFYKISRQSNFDFHRIIFHKPDLPEKMVKVASEFDIGLALEQDITINRDICLTNKMFTYFLAGNAIIATDTAGQREIKNSANRAIKFYEPGNIQKLAEIINYWYENRDELSKARNESWKLGTNKFNWDIEKHKFIQIVNRILI